MFKKKNDPRENPRERRKRERRSFSHYMRLMNENTGELIGHLVNISPEGFQLESLKPVPPNTDYPMRIEVPEELGSKPFIVFIARSKWCQRDRIDPGLYDTGFQIVDMNPNDLEVFQLIFEKYGSSSDNRDGTADYLWGR
jgi:hypothetical protein